MRTNERIKGYPFFFLLIGIIVFSPCKESRAQKNIEQQPIITHGPYLTAPSKTSITITWKTNMPAQSKIKYGIGDQLNHTIEPQNDGFLPVDSLHTINLTNLQPGQLYNYQVISTGVKELKPYWPEKTRAVESPVYSFSTFGSEDSTVSFSFITDSQYENVNRLNSNLDLVDWKESDFLVHGGDALSWVKDPEQIFLNFLDPISKRLNHTKPFVYVRGNHEMRGPYARSFKKYVQNPSGRYYYAFNAGPVHFVVLDTGEDKADSHEAYGGLNNLKSYRDQEFRWFKNHVQTSKELSQAPFRIIFMHAPKWGWVDGEKEKWTEIANEADIDLIIAGHWHRFSLVDEGKYDNDYPILVVDQDQVARVEATEDVLNVTVIGEDRVEVDSFSIK